MYRFVSYKLTTMFSANMRSWKGISYFYKTVVTAVKNHKNRGPKTIQYRNYKHSHEQFFETEQWVAENWY